MDELVRLVSQKTGIAEDKARTAVVTVLDFLKERLPAPIASQIDNLLRGSGTPGDISKGLGDLFSKK